MKYVLILQNGEVMNGVSYETLEAAQAACEEFGAEYVATESDSGLVEYVE